MKNKIYGMYNTYGYAVYEILNNGYFNTLYTAGNSRFDSQDYLDPNDAGALSLRTIRTFCIQTSKEMAREQKAKYVGNQRDIDAEREKHAPA